jgi:hypothetical protein
VTLPPHIRGKNKEELLELFGGGVEPGSVAFGQYQAALAVQAVKDLERVGQSLEAAITEAAKASDRLGSRVFWLNVVLTAATVVGALAALLAIFL